MHARLEVQMWTGPGQTRQHVVVLDGVQPAFSEVRHDGDATALLAWSAVAVTPEKKHLLDAWAPLGIDTWAAELVDERGRLPARVLCRVSATDAADLAHLVGARQIWTGLLGGPVQPLVVTPRLPLADTHPWHLRIPGRDGPVAVEELTLENLSSGYLEGGPEGDTILDHMRRGRPWPRLAAVVCRRVDERVHVDVRSSDVVRIVPPFLCTARVAFDATSDDGRVEGRRAFVTWMSNGLGAVSLEELLLEGVGEVDLTMPATPMRYATPARPALRRLTTKDGVDVAMHGCELLLGPTRDEHGELTPGAVRLTTTLIGPEPSPRPPTPAGLGVGRWHTDLRWRPILEPGGTPLDDVIRGAARSLDWARNATQVCTIQVNVARPREGGGGGGGGRW